MNKRCCQYPICFTCGDNRPNDEMEFQGISRSPFTSVSVSEFKCVINKNKHATSEIYVTCKILQKTFHLGVNLSDQISDIKNQIMYLEKVPAVLLHLFFKGILLGDMHTLEECGIKENSTLTLGIKLHTAWCKKCRSPCKFTTRELTNLTVKSILGDIYNVILPLSNPVETLKELMEKKFMIYPDHQLIVHDGNNLEDDVTLAEYGITEESDLIILAFQYEKCSYCAGCAKTAQKPTITLKFFDYTVTWALDPNQTVRELKEITYRYLHHVHPDLQRLTFKNHELLDEETLEESSLDNGSEVIVTLRFDRRKCDICDACLI